MSNIKAAEDGLASAHAIERAMDEQWKNWRYQPDMLIVLPGESEPRRMDSPEVKAYFAKVTRS